MARKPNLRLNLNAQKNEELEMRSNLDMNSPTTELGGPAEVHYDDTPQSKVLRQQYGFNSPRSDENDNEVEFNPPTPQDKKGGGIESLVTQVPDERNNTGSSPDDLMTQVPRPQTKKKPVAEQKNPPTSDGGGWCSCFSPGPDQESEDENPNEYQRQETPEAPARPKSAAVAPSASPVVEETEADIRREEEGLLGRRKPENRNKKCLVIDLDETLVHSSFKPVPTCDFIVPVTIDNVVHNVYVLVRHYAAEFLKECAKDYEIVLFTASLSKYADPLLDLLDTHEAIEYRLFRESCVNIGYSYVKDLSQLGRKMSEIMIIDNSPQSYRFQPCNAIPITSWFDDPNDTELEDLMPVMRTTLKNCKDVRDVLDASKSMQWLFAQATE